jgi:hypothetical protein
MDAVALGMPGDHESSQSLLHTEFVVIDGNPA